MSETYLPMQVVPVLKLHKLGRLYLPAIAVKIQENEWEWCDRVSGNLWANSKKNHYGRGIINSEEDKFKAERCGLLGEMAFSKISGLAVDGSYQKGGKPFDFESPIGGEKIDIKTASKLNAWKAGLIYCETSSGNEITLNADIYVFSYIADEDRLNKKATIIIIGWCQKELVINKPKVKARVGFHLNKEIPYKELTPINTLIEKINPECIIINKMNTDHHN